MLSTEGASPIIEKWNWTDQYYSWLRHNANCHAIPQDSESFTQNIGGEATEAILDDFCWEIWLNLQSGSDLQSSHDLSLFWVSKAVKSTDILFRVLKVCQCGPAPVSDADHTDKGELDCFSDDSLSQIQ